VSSGSAIGASEEVHRFESELEINKQNLREDAAQIRQKIGELKQSWAPQISFANGAISP
jgi:hypothetical protein